MAHYEGETLKERIARGPLDLNDAIDIGAEIDVIERCSGHGGSWGVMKDNFDVALKIGTPVARDVAKAKPEFVVSECPLARDHILQGIERLGEDTPGINAAQHPIQLMARAYGL